jgi:hypothetical protein
MTTLAEIFREVQECRKINNFNEDREERLSDQRDKVKKTERQALKARDKAVERGVSQTELTRMDENVEARKKESRESREKFEKYLLTNHHEALVSDRQQPHREVEEMGFYEAGEYFTLQVLMYIKK